YGNAVFIEQGADVLGVRLIHDQRQRGRLVLGGADDAQARHVSDGLGGGSQQGVFVRSDGVQIEAAQIVYGSAEADHAGDVGGAGLELVGQFVPGAAVERHGFDHVVADLPQRNIVEQVSLDV